MKVQFKKIILSIAIILSLVSITNSAKAYSLVTPRDNYIWKYITTAIFNDKLTWEFETILTPLGDEFGIVKNKVSALEIQNNNLQQQITKLQEEISLLKNSNNAPSAINTPVSEVVTKPYVTYKNDPKVYEYATGRYISFDEAVKNNIWNSIQNLSFSK